MATINFENKFTFDTETLDKMDNGQIAAVYEDAAKKVFSTTSFMANGGYAKSPVELFTQIQIMIYCTQRLSGLQFNFNGALKSLHELLSAQTLKSVSRTYRNTGGADNVISSMEDKKKKVSSKYKAFLIDKEAYDDILAYAQEYRVSHNDLDELDWDIYNKLADGQTLAKSPSYQKACKEEMRRFNAKFGKKK